MLMPLSIEHDASDYSSCECAATWDATDEQV